jgi:surfeit locus 1 family protein
LVDAALKPLAPVFIDLPAGLRGALPQGGETEVDYTNNHLGYAYTWLGFALTTIIMLAEWVRRQLDRRRSTS